MKRKLFNKTLNITTKENKKYTIENKNVFIHGSLENYTNADIMQKDNNIYIIKEIYSYEDDRIRFSYTEFVNAKAYNTIEKNDEKEIPVMVIENYDRVNTFIDSIGNITELTSDIEQEKHKELPKILKLIIFLKEFSNSN